MRPERLPAFRASPDNGDATPQTRVASPLSGEALTAEFELSEPPCQREKLSIYLLFEMADGERIRLRNSIGPWSPCKRIGPGDPSSLSSAPPVMPGMTCRSIIRSPLSTTVTVRPTRVISMACHCPARFAALTDGVRNP